MNRRDFVTSTFACAAALAVSPKAFGQAQSSAKAKTKAIEPDLAALAEGKRLKVFNRSAVTPLIDGARKGIHLNEAQGPGIAYLEGMEFANGTIELDIRGKDAQGQSFVGVAFHGVDGATYDAIYFRPFNFKSEDPERRVHAVQYISHPTYTWNKLRTEHPNQYEKAVNPVPDPNGWFHARIVVASPKVSVFVNDAKEPSLVVTQLSDRGKGLTGVWVDNFGGDFANFKITPA